MKGALYSLYFLFKNNREHYSLFVVRTTEQSLWTSNDYSTWTCAFRKHKPRPCFTSLDFGASIQKLEKYILKKHNCKKRETLTLAASKNELCVCVKQQNRKGKKKKKQKKEKKKEKLSISSENQRRLPHWLFPFVILIVLRHQRYQRFLSLCGLHFACALLQF